MATATLKEGLVLIVSFKLFANLRLRKLLELPVSISVATESSEMCPSSRMVWIESAPVSACKEIACVRLLFSLLGSHRKRLFIDYFITNFILPHTFNQKQFLTFMTLELLLITFEHNPGSSCLAIVAPSSSSYCSLVLYMIWNHLS